MTNVLERHWTRSDAADVSEDSQASDVDDSYPLSSLQQGMLFHALWEKGSGVDVQQYLIDLHEALDVGKLQRAWRRIIARHPVLRTSFRWEDLNEPEQQVHAKVELPWEEQDWRACTDVEREKRFADFLAADRSQCFDMARAPLLRLTLLRYGEADNRLVWTYHHILLDGTSRTLLLREVFAYYDAFLRDEDITRPQPRSYRDYIDWLQQQDFRKDESFWRQMLKGFTAPTRLSVDHAPELTGGDVNRAGSQDIKLSTEITSALRSMAEENGLTLATIMQGAWAILLSRYSGETDVVFGVVRSNRRGTIEGADNVIGLCINTLPMRLKVNSEIMLLSWLKDVRAQWIPLRDHAHTPLVEVQGWSEVPARHPLFASILNFQSYDLDTNLRMQGAAWSNRRVRLIQQTSYPVSLSVNDGDELQLKILFDCSRFDDDAAGRILGHLRTLLEGMATKPEQKVGELPLLTSSERHQLLVEWNQTEVDYPRDKCVHQLFEAQVERTPDAMAVVFEDHCLTYRELNDRANQLAHYLRKHQVAADTLVGLCIKRSPDMVVSILGVLKAGGAYVPMDPTYPKERLAYMLEDTRAPILITQQPLLKLLPEHKATTICLDTHWDCITREGTENVGQTAKPENLAYVIYTSGSTGHPKGTMIIHRGLVNYLAWGIKAYDAAQGCGAPVHSSISFDLTITSLFAPLLVGRSVYLVPEEGELQELIDIFLRNDNFSLVKITPAHLQLLGQQLPSDRVANLTRRFIIGGENLLWDSLASWLNNAPDIALINEYGPTETVVGCCVYRVARGERQTGSVPIGRPIANTHLFILDQYKQPVPIGATGELYIGGAGVARGYLNQPKLTAERFIQNPFSASPEDRLYRTGDLARYRSDGNIEFLGRIDHQVKVRGFRIEPGEIESVLKLHPAAREAVVVAREDVPGDKRLVAYVRSVASHDNFIKELRAGLKQRLPPYMVPSDFVVLQAFPLTPNGKLDRKALPAPQYDRSALGDMYVAPRNSLEELVARIWREVLKLEQVGVHDNFFELGGHSLLATQVVARVGKLLKVDLPLRRFFETATVSALAAELQKVLGAGETGDARSIVPVPRTGNLPLSFAQQRLWLLDQLLPNKAAYNIPTVWQLRGQLDALALERSLNELVARHETLRTRFVLSGDAPVQVIGPPSAVALPITDLSAIPQAEREARARQITDTEAHQPFDLEAGPLLRAQLLRLGAEEHLLLLNVHHIVSDGWSMGVLWRELSGGYTAFVSGHAPDLPRLPIQYADYAVWQREWLKGEVLEGQLAYWKEKLADLSTLELPTDRPRPPVPSYQGAHLTFDLPAPLTQALKELSRREGTTLFMTLLAAFQVLLHRYSGQDDIAVGTPIAGRGRTELEGLIGFFLNTLVLRSNLAGNPAFTELLAQVRETALGAYTHQDLPFEKLVEELSPSRDISRNPLFDVMINQVDSSEPSLDFSGLVARQIPLPSASAKFAITLYIRTRAHGVELRLVYQSELFSSARIASMLEQYVHLLEQIATAPEKSINDYSLVTASARTLLPDPMIPIEVRSQQSVMAQVLTWARIAPERVAVSAGGKHWTYAELTERARLLATTLREMGIRRGDVIAIMGPRSFGLIGSMLGVLMSGGAFLTIDPTLPTQRKRVMLREARAKVLCLIGPPGDNDWHLAEDETLAVLRADLDLASLLEAARSSDRDWSLPTIHGDDPAYVFFTSGSTGRPKAILGCHKGLSHFLRWQRNTFAIGTEDRVSQLIGLTFDVLLRDVFLPLTSGARLCLPTESDFLDTIGWMKRENITVVHTTPTVMQSWLLETDRRVELEFLRWLFISGEPLTDALIGKWRRRISGPAQLVNLYGPTETTMVRCFYPIPTEVTHGIQPIGLSLPESQALVLNAGGLLCGIGETGEIVLRTPYRSLGYLNLAEENQRRFRPNPFRNDESDLLYFTGDRGRYRADGLLEIAGRVDDQVKIRGVLVEPGEVTATLARHEAVRDCVVVGHPGDDGQHRLVGYVVADTGKQLEARDLRAYLSEQLPEAFVPSAFVFLDALPVLPNGKVDRRALPAPQYDRSALGDMYVAPRNSLEELVARVWREVLKLEQVGVHDNFFELGGHSLLATQVVARVGKLLKVDLPLRRFFETATVSALAAELQKVLGAGETGDARSIVPVPRTGNLPLSFAQQRLWLLDQLLPNKAAYNIPTVWQLRGQLDALALERSLNELVARHETLRTRFVLSGDAPVQVIGPPSAVALPITDLSAMPQAEREARARQITDTEAHQPFDLEAGPLLRAQLLRLGAEEHLLLLNVHHIVSDGWSMGVLWRELSSGYTAFVSGHAPDLPRLPIQYADYAVWQREWLKGEVLEGQLAYWKEKLADLSTLELPTDRPRPPVPSYQGAHLTFDLPAPLTQALKELSRREGATLFMTLLAAFQVLLHRYSGQDDIAVGTPIAGRGRTELEGLIGFFVNTLVLRSNLAGNPAFTELLAQVRETALGAYTHQDLPFEKLVEELSPSRDISRNPLFQVMFVLQNAPDAELMLRGVQASRLPLPGHSAKFDLTVTMGETAAGLHVRWEYSTDLFDTSTVERMAQHFKMLLEGIVADADQRIGQLLLLTEAERHQLPVEWDQTELKRKASLEDSYPLSSLQHGMLFHALWEKGTGVYIVQVLIDLHETLDVGKFQRAWRRIIARHPVLRTSFRWEDLNEPEQQVHAKVELPWEEQDLRAFTDAEREKWFADFLAADRRRGFNMAHAPLLRLTLLRCGEADNRLIWTYHHILLDGTSRTLLLREVFAYYEAFLRDEDITRPQPRPYRDYIDWLQQQDFRKDESFWRQQLKGITAPTRLSVDHAPELSGGGGNSAGSQNIKLSAEITSALRSMAEENGLTLATIMQGAWAILLSRYSGEADVVFGVVRSNRRGTIEGADDVIGLCMNTLPMRLKVNSEIMLLSWLKDVRAQWIPLRDHAHTPLVEVQGWSEVPARHPLFASIVNFIAPHFDTQWWMQGGAGRARRVRMLEQTNYPVSLSVYDGAELHLEILFDRSRINDDAAERMLGHLRTLLEGMATKPEQKVGELPLLTSSERHQLLVDWNQTEVDYPRDKCVHQLFETQVERTPHAVAVAFEQSELTYAKLNARSNQLARYLQRHGVRRGSFVACCMGRTSDLIVTLLATLKSGGAYVALDTNIPSKRLHSILENARPAVLVVKSQLEKATIDSIRSVEGAKIAGLPIVVCLDQHAKSISNESTENLDSETTSENLAYVCFTSGSSGEPKGVSIPHRAIVRLVKNTTYVSLSSSDVFLQFAPVSFDASTFEIWGCLLNGGQLVVLPSEKLSLAHLGSAIRKYNVSVLWLTAGLFHQMVDHELDSLTGVRQLLAGGDVLSIAHVRKALARLGESRLINGYGPTENTTFTCCYSITHLSTEEHSIPIGRPISNTQCFILDHDLQPVPIGVRGELFVSGDGLARGYLNDLKLTAEKFFPNPFRPGSLLYRTGDFARYRSDGNIEFLGRIDNQVKIRGYRIELGEIESVLKLHPTVKEAVVVAREDIPGDRRLVAYVTPANAAKAGELRGFLKERLPDYMLPSAFVFIDAFPLTPNGKLDRKALPPPHERSPEFKGSYVAPRTPTEEVLASIWREVLTLKQVSVHDNFFELGGHSLLAVQLRFQIQQTLEIEIPLAAIYLRPTIEGIALSVLQQKVESLDAKEAEGLFAELEGVLDD